MTCDEHAKHTQSSQPPFRGPDGWAKVQQEAIGRAKYSTRTSDWAQVRDEFVAKLCAGDFVAVYCGDAEARFTVAKVLERQGGSAVHKAEKSDAGWKIRKGAQCVDVEWIDRVDDTLKFKPDGGGLQKVETRCLLPQKVEWLRSGRAQLIMSDSVHDGFCDMCDKILDIA